MSLVETNDFNFLINNKPVFDQPGKKRCQETITIKKKLIRLFIPSKT